MKTRLAAAIVLMASAFGMPAVAGPTFSTGGACVDDTVSRAPGGARQVLLSNPSKLYLAATLYRKIDEPNFKYVDADGAERTTDFPYHYQVFVPPHGNAPVGCTRLFIAGGEAAQTFALQKTDYFLDPPMDNTEEPRAYVGLLRGPGARLINLHATKTIHITVAHAGGAIRLDLPPQSVSIAPVGGERGAQDPPRFRLTEAHF